jgi:hypothetical protein
MSDAPAPSQSQSDNPFELAAIVAKRVQIESVLLAKGVMKRRGDTDLMQEGVSLQFNIKRVEFVKEEERKRLLVKPTFSVTIAHGAEPRPPQDFLIRATFVLFYSVKSFEGIEDKHLDAFSMTNGIFNAWPYWREFVQNTVTRMGFSPITVPVFRF